MVCAIARRVIPVGSLRGSNTRSNSVEDRGPTRRKAQRGGASSLSLSFTIYPEPMLRAKSGDENSLHSAIGRAWNRRDRSDNNHDCHDYCFVLNVLHSARKARA